MKLHHFFFWRCPILTRTYLGGVSTSCGCAVDNIFRQIYRLWSSNDVRCDLPEGTKSSVYRWHLAPSENHPPRQQVPSATARRGFWRNLKPLGTPKSWLWKCDSTKKNINWNMTKKKRQKETFPKTWSIWNFWPSSQIWVNSQQL